VFNENALKNYNSILTKEKKPKYLNLPKEKLKEKVSSSYEILNSCELCERKCGINRNAGKIGVCNVSFLKINSFFPHFGEEPFFVPSFTVFFSGCNFKCVFCQNYTISQFREGNEISVQELSSIMQKANSCKNLNLVGGDPIPFLPWILDALQRTKLSVPVIWNSNLFLTEKSFGLLHGVIDVFLSDWKYGSNSCAEKLSGIKNYWETISRNHSLAFQQAELVIRHLILPGHFQCCTKKILQEISYRFQDKVVVNLMNQFRPEFKAIEYGLDRGISREEFQKAVSLAEELELNFIV
jgi:putative pyruvate formate lyase activating enzyme